MLFVVKRDIGTRAFLILLIKPVTKPCTRHVVNRQQVWSLGLRIVKITKIAERRFTEQAPSPQPEFAVSDK